MQTLNTTPATFSNGVLEVAIPTRWEELSQAQLKYICYLKTLNFSETEITAYAFFRFAGLTILGKDGYNWFIEPKKYIGKRAARIAISKYDLLDFCTRLNFLFKLDTPVRLISVKGHKAIDAYLHNVPFEMYLNCEILWQAWLLTEKDEALCKLAGYLYQSDEQIEISPIEKINVIQWFSGFKSFCGEHWPNFFKAAEDASEEISGGTIEKSMNLQIRALTGGDVTKENEILGTDTWRALTELDFLAADAAAQRKNLKL